MAVVILTGLLTSTLLSLFLVLVLFACWGSRPHEEEARSARAAAERVEESSF
jgi:Cu/Ag efflux pump CusA